MIGLKQGIVQLQEHDPSWETIAAQTIQCLKAIFGKVATDIQHVGSTAILSIKAKPIIDLAVAVKYFPDVKELIPSLEEAGFKHLPDHDTDWQIFFCCGDKIERGRTHHIHVVKTNGKQWIEYLKFRDYLNGENNAAVEYETLKKTLQVKYANDRVGYTEGKAALIQKILHKASRA